jgi:RNA polymerase sigma factor (sigma-70 family)
MEIKTAVFQIREFSALEGIDFCQQGTQSRLLKLLEEECRSHSNGKRYFPISILREVCRQYLKRVTLEAGDKLVFYQIFSDAILNVMTDSRDRQVSRLGSLLREMVKQLDGPDADKALLLRLHFVIGLQWNEIMSLSGAEAIVLDGETTLSKLKADMEERGISPESLMQQNLRPRGEVTQLLENVRDGQRPLGDVVVHERLKLKRQAQHLLRLEGGNVSWQADDLVNEMFLRMPKEPGKSPVNHLEFEALARRIMRHALIDRARKPIPGQGRFREELREDISDSSAVVEDRIFWKKAVEVVEDVIRDLRRSDPESAEMLHATLYRNVDQSYLAKLHGVSVSTVKRRIKEGRNRIRRRLGLELKK